MTTTRNNTALHFDDLMNRTMYVTSADCKIPIAIDYDISPICSMANNTKVDIEVPIDIMVELNAMRDTYHDKVSNNIKCPNSTSNYMIDYYRGCIDTIDNVMELLQGRM